MFRGSYQKTVQSTSFKNDVSGAKMEGWELMALAVKLTMFRIQLKKIKDTNSHWGSLHGIQI